MTGKEETGRVARIMEFLPASSSCTVGGKRMRNIPRNAIAKWILLRIRAQLTVRRRNRCFNPRSIKIWDVSSVSRHVTLPREIPPPESAFRVRVLVTHIIYPFSRTNKKNTSRLQLADFCSLSLYLWDLRVTLVPDRQRQTRSFHCCQKKTAEGCRS